jgi:hypothetical protein
MAMIEGTFSNRVLARERARNKLLQILFAVPDVHTAIT